MVKVGLISDLHNRLPRRAKEVLKDCEHIICAGDFSSPKFLAELEELAPVTAVRGNCDHGPWASDLPETQLVEFEDVSFYILHNLDHLDLNPEDCGINCVVFGHTHFSRQYYYKDVLYLNPGSVSEPRYGQNPSVMIVTVKGEVISPKIIEI